jgi:hypothetical protein
MEKANSNEMEVITKEQNYNETKFYEIFYKIFHLCKTIAGYSKTAQIKEALNSPNNPGLLAFDLTVLKGFDSAMGIFSESIETRLGELEDLLSEVTRTGKLGIMENSEQDETENIIFDSLKSVSRLCNMIKGYARTEQVLDISNPPKENEDTKHVEISGFSSSLEVFSDNIGKELKELEDFAGGLLTHKALKSA